MVSELVDHEDVQLPKRNVWADYLFRPLIVTTMITCVSISIVALGRALSPNWWGGHLLIGMVLATVESIYSFRILRHPRSRGISMQRYRLAEWGTLAILLKIISYIGRPWAEIWPSVEMMIRQPGTFFSMDYFLMLFLALIAWGLAYGTMMDFEALYDPFTFRSETITPMNKLATRFYWGGGIIIIAAGLSFIADQSGLAGLVELATFDRPRIGGIALNVLVYFVLGLLMLSQVRLTSLMTRWHIQRVSVADGLGKSWAKYGLAFLGLVALLVIFLPTGYSLGLFDTTVLALRFFVDVMIKIVQVIMFLITLPLAWLASLFGSEGAVQPPPRGAGMGGLGPPPEGGGPMPSWVEIMRSLAFWLTFVFVAWYLVKTYLADHPELLEALKKFTPFRWAFGLAATLVVWLVQLIRAGIDLIPKAVDLQPQAEENKKQRKKRRRWGFSGRLSSREQILYYYLNMLKRAEETGLRRQRYQTPYEFEPSLRQSIPDVETDVDLLTQAFVHARYSRDTFDNEHVAMIKTVWQRIQTALRERRKAKDKGEEQSLSGRDRE